MIELPLPSEARRLREYLIATGYSEEGLTHALATAVPPNRNALSRLLFLTREPGALNTLARLFLMGLDVEQRRAADTLPQWFINLGRQAGFIDEVADALRPRVLIVPINNLLFASDALSVLGSETAAEFVLPASTHAARYLLNLSLRKRVDDSLDLGTGCGVQAIFAAAHSKRVVATDISERAICFAELNARLNGCDNVEFLTGDLFGPVAGRRFDLIVTNPPFVVGPGRGLVYRDSGMELDGLCRKLAREAPEYLNQGGMLQMLCEWAETEDTPWREHLESWFEGAGCDAWVLRSLPQTPAAYAELRLGEISGPGLSRPSDFDEWMAYFDAHRVMAIHPGLIVMRRREGRNWLHIHNLGTDVTEPAGERILDGFAACDFLDTHATDESLLKANLSLSPHLRLEQVYARTDNEWKLDKCRLELAHALPMEAELDAPIAALLNGFDGSRSVKRCIRKFAREANADPTEITRQFLPVVRLLVERGFLLPRNPP